MQSSKVDNSFLFLDIRTPAAEPLADVRPMVAPAGQGVGSLLQLPAVGRGALELLAQEGVDGRTRIGGLGQSILPELPRHPPAIELIPDLVGAVALGGVVPHHRPGVFSVVQQSQPLQPVGGLRRLGLVGQGRLLPVPGAGGEPVDEQAVQALLQELLSFTALATVCDVMELRDENRILVREGLKEMAKTTNYGLKALLQVNDLYGKPLTPYHAGFVIGPCLNATGRLDTAKRALELFDASSIEEAALIASDLKSMNESRKQMTEDGVKLATQQVEQELSGDDILVVYLPDCHESLAGIIAGRIREKYHKPVFVLTSAEEGVKGSGRSIEAYSMYEEMNKVKELFARFGGHRQAAGLTLAAEDGFSDAQLADRFRKALNANSTLKSEDFEEVVHIDVPLPLKLADRNFLAELEKLEPFGTGNPKPLFARKQISILSMAKLGKTGKFRRIRIADEQGNPYQAVYFGDGEEMDRYLMQKYGEERLMQGYRGGLMQGQMEISIVYSPQINSYNGRESIQILIQYYQ